MKPTLQVHVNEPGVSWQVAFGLQVLNVKHSLISEIITNSLHEEILTLTYIIFHEL